MRTLLTLCLRAAGRRGMSPAGGVVRTGHDGQIDGRRIEHQGGRRADRAGARDDPHVGAALRVPDPAAHRLGLPALRARGHRDAAPRAGSSPARAQVLRKSTLIALSRAIEHELLARAAAPVLFGAFQRERFYRALEPRWRRMARHADAATVFADFATLRQPSGAPVEVPIAEGEALANEWAVIVDAPGYAASLLAWEQPGAIEPGGPEDLDRRFEAIWTIDPQATRRAAQAAARLTG